MPTKEERDYYSKGFEDGIAFAEGRSSDPKTLDLRRSREYAVKRSSPKRKLSAWNKYVKANSNKPRFRLRSGKLNLKKMGVAFRKTPAGRKK
jgi:hypothetical protein